MPTKTIGLVGGNNSDEWIGLAGALCRALGLQLRHARLEERDGLDGFILIGSLDEFAKVPQRWARPSIHIVSSDLPSVTTRVRFGTGPYSPFPFKGRSLEAETVVPQSGNEGTGEVIATANGNPVWRSRLEKEARHDVCWANSPQCSQGEFLFHHFNGSRFMTLLPLFEWLRWLSGWHEWVYPSTRACFMFDDPNLHSKCYGFVCFASLAEQGRRHHYHTSFATVPLDGYYVNQTAVRILRENQQTLSLLVHGNNHSHLEWAASRPSSKQLASIRQAMLRIEGVESKAMVSVAKVMAPPHGVCSAEMMAGMAAAGFEAACVSNGSVAAGNNGASWLDSLGIKFAMTVSGLPVIPRFALKPRTENEILLAAYLRQPIIPVGHHWDLINGTEILSSAAGIINSLGDVAWSDMTAIARGNHRYQIQGNRMRVESFSRITIVEVPEGVSTLELETPWFDPAEETIQCGGSKISALGGVATIAMEGSCSVAKPGAVELRVVRRNEVHRTGTASLPTTSITLIARRLLTEARDRVMPYVPRPWVRL